MNIESNINIVKLSAFNKFYKIYSFNFRFVYLMLNKNARVTIEVDLS